MAPIKTQTLICPHRKLSKSKLRIYHPTTQRKANRKTCHRQVVAIARNTITVCLRVNMRRHRKSPIIQAVVRAAAVAVPCPNQINTGELKCTLIDWFSPKPLWRPHHWNSIPELRTIPIYLYFLLFPNVRFCTSAYLFHSICVLYLFISFGFMTKRGNRFRQSDEDSVPSGQMYSMCNCPLSSDDISVRA